MNNLFSKEAREFNSYDATVAKTSLKIASLSLFFIIMLICITFESSWDYTGAEVWSQSQREVFKVAAVCSRSLQNLRNGHFTS